MDEKRLTELVTFLLTFIILGGTAIIIFLFTLVADGIKYGKSYCPVCKRLEPVEVDSSKC